MLYIFPHYYRQFQCIASECRDTCCAGWEIMIDEGSLERYRKVKGPFGNRLHNSINWKEGSFKQYHYRCAFLDEDNLCDIYREMGPEHLCRTCRRYPRHIEEFEGVREVSLCLSCVEAAKLILGCKEPVRFFAKEDDREETYGDFDFFLYTKLADARDLALEILQDRTMDIQARTGLCLAMAHDLQRCIRRDRLYEADSLFKRCKRADREAYLWERLSRKGLSPAEGGKNEGCTGKETQSAYQSRYEMAKHLFALLAEMEPLKKDWPKLCRRMEQCLYGAGNEAYAEARSRFLGSMEKEELSRYREQLMVYFVFTYFCGAVYNGNPYGKMKLAVAGSFLIEEMAQSMWQEKGSLGLTEMAEAAHYFSREMEHSDENKALFEKRLLGSPDFGLYPLLRAICG